jgi:hypothetical protein
MYNRLLRQRCLSSSWEVLMVCCGLVSFSVSPVSFGSYTFAKREREREGDDQTSGCSYCSVSTSTFVELGSFDGSESCCGLAKVQRSHRTSFSRSRSRQFRQSTLLSASIHP